MASTFEEIVDGWKNYIFPNATTEDLAKTRLVHCMTCEWRSKTTNKCKLCGCPIDKAVRSIPKKCPVGKW